MSGWVKVGVDTGFRKGGPLLTIQQQSGCMHSYTHALMHCFFSIVILDPLAYTAPIAKT